MTFSNEPHHSSQSPLKIEKRVPHSDAIMLTRFPTRATLYGVHQNHFKCRIDVNGLLRRGNCASPETRSKPSTRSTPSGSRGLLHEFSIRHERLKHAIHNGFRYPLPRWGRFVMGCIYFSIPVVSGWYVMQWAIHQSHKSIGEHGELLPQKELQGLGDRTVDARGNQLKVGGPEGWGGGVRLAVSDETTQQRNREMLNNFFRKQQKKLAAERRKNRDEEGAEGES
jgi:hypothetical protein